MKLDDNKQARVLVKVQTARDRFTMADSALTVTVTTKNRVWGLFKLWSISDLGPCISFTSRPTYEGELVASIYKCVYKYIYTNMQILFRKQ